MPGHDISSLLAFMVPGLIIIAVLLVVMLATGENTSRHATSQGNVQQIRPPKRRSSRTYQPPLLGLTRVSGIMLSDPDFWRERREAENEAEAAETATVK